MLVFETLVLSLKEKGKEKHFLIFLFYMKKLEFSGDMKQPQQSDNVHFAASF